MKEQINVAELRSKTSEFFRSRKLQVPANWTDEQIVLFDKHILSSYRQKVNHGTRGNSRIRASGAYKPAPTPVTTPSDSEADALHRQALTLRIANLK